MVTEALLRVLRHAWLTLEPLGLPMAVLGGIAMTAWHRPRATHDVDLLISIGQADVDEILERLRQAGFFPLNNPPIRRVRDAIRLIQVGYEPPGMLVHFRVDVLLADTEYMRVAIERRQPTVLPGTEDMSLSVVAAEDLILLKLLAGRVIDRADAAAVLRANRDEIDVPYLLQWSDHLGLAEDLYYIWDEAFPGESPPRSA